MKQLIFAAPLLVLSACGGDAETADDSSESAMENAQPEAQVDAGVEADEAAARRESQIATWAANFSLSEEQATCLVDSVAWDALIAAEQTAETVEQITACGTDPATFAAYGQ